MAKRSKKPSPRSKSSAKRSKPSSTRAKRSENRATSRAARATSSSIRATARKESSDRPRPPRPPESPPALATPAGVPPPLAGVPRDQVGATVQRFIDFDGVRSIRADEEPGGLTVTVMPLA